MTTVDPGQAPTPESTPGASTPTTPATTPTVDPSTPTPENPQPTETPSGKMYDEAYVKGLRTENANYRTKANTLQEQIDAFNREKLTKEQQLETDLRKANEEVIPSLQAENRTLQVQVASTKFGIVDAEAAAILVAPKLASGSSIEDALTALITEKPWLKAPEPTTTTPTTPTTPAATPTTTAIGAPAGSQVAFTYTKSQLNAMSTKEMIAQKDQIDAAIAAGHVDMTR